MFENVFKLLKIKKRILYIFDTRGGGGGSTTRFLGLNPHYFAQVGRVGKGQRTIHIHIRYLMGLAIGD